MVQELAMPSLKPSVGQDLLHIAQREGVSSQAILNCPENRDLLACRAPGVLFHEDEVFVPAPEPKIVRVRVGETAYLVYRPARRKLQLILRDSTGAFLDCDYTLRAFEYDGTEGERIPGPLHSYAYRGVIDEELPAGVKKLELVINDQEPLALALEVGRLDPVSTLRGLKGRLRNLGFYRGPLDDEFEPGLIDACRGFQLSRGLPATGQPDGATCKALVEVHGN